MKTIHEVLNLKLRRDKPAATAEPRKEKKLAFGNIMAGVGTAMLIGACSPDVTINNIPYDPSLPDGGVCAPVTDCVERQFSLRESGSSAGPNSQTVGDAEVTLKSIKDESGTKKAEIELVSCEETASETLTAESSVTLTTGTRSFVVYVDTIRYDSAGLIVEGTVTPVCSPDAGVSDAGSD